MITIYCVLSAYLFVSSSPPSLGIALREVVSPFQMKARARNTAREQRIAAWRLSELENRTRQRLG